MTKTPARGSRESAASIAEFPQRRIRLLVGAEHLGANRKATNWRGRGGRRRTNLVLLMAMCAADRAYCRSPWLRLRIVGRGRDLLLSRQKIAERILRGIEPSVLPAIFRGWWSNVLMDGRITFASEPLSANDQGMGSGNGRIRSHCRTPPCRRL